MSTSAAVTGTWLAQGATTVPGWLEVPEGLNAMERQQWIDSCVGELRNDWAERWADSFEVIVGEMLQDALDRRGDDLQVFQVWPLKATMTATVRIAIAPSDDMPDWRDIGGRVQEIEAPGIGPGLQISGQRDEGEDVTTVVLAFAFDDGTTTLLIRVEPTLLEMLTLVVPGLEGLLQALILTRPDGSQFRSVQPKGILPSEEIFRVHPSELREDDGTEA